jgi:hypothetical protein
MSLIHLEKSVLTFHLREILEDGHGGHPFTWLGLGALILGPKLLPIVVKAAQPVVNILPVKPLQQPVSLAQWIAEAKQREMAFATATELKTTAQVSIVPCDQPSDAVSLQH